MMKKTIFLLALLLCATCLFAINDTLQPQAEAFYVQGRYAEAAEKYELIVRGNQESSKLYYNLGNAYYKSGENTKAILNYERALLLNPSDNDARYNLKIAQRQIVDKIEELPVIFFVRWYNSLVSFFSADQWAYLSIALFVFFLVSITFFFYSSTVWLKKTGFSVAALTLFLTVATVVFTSKQNVHVEQRNAAIIMAPSVTVKGSPDGSGTDLFVVHEGLKVEVKEKLGDWYNIHLQDGNEGWVRQNDLEII
jgi:tetratricopeptide (TPR) repeat protein